VLRQSAEWLGGSPEDHKGLVLAAWSLLHGTAMLNITGTYRDEDVPLARAAFERAVDVLVTNARKLQDLKTESGDGSRTIHSKRDRRG
jgi:hypothetical protein